MSQDCSFFPVLWSSDCLKDEILISLEELWTIIKENKNFSFIADAIFIYFFPYDSTYYYYSSDGKYTYKETVDFLDFSHQCNLLFTETWANENLDEFSYFYISTYKKLAGKMISNDI